jgi:hypothetical protein
MAQRDIVGIGQYDYSITHLSICADAGVHLDEAYLGWMLEQAEAARSPMIKAATLRAIGVKSRDPARLEAARALFDSCSAVPFAARARSEGAILEGNEGEFKAGLTYLESIGHVVQTERYLRAFRQIAQHERE